jgi:hypothetical protein
VWTSTAFDRTLIRSGLRLPIAISPIRALLHHSDVVSETFLVCYGGTF